MFVPLRRPFHTLTALRWKCPTSYRPGSKSFFPQPLPRPPRTSLMQVSRGRAQAIMVDFKIGLELMEVSTKKNASVSWWWRGARVTVLSGPRPSGLIAPLSVRFVVKQPFLTSFEHLKRALVPISSVRGLSAGQNHATKFSKKLQAVCAGKAGPRKGSSPSRRRYTCQRSTWRHSPGKEAGAILLFLRSAIRRV